MENNLNNEVLNNFFKHYESKAIEYYKTSYIKIQEHKLDNKYTASWLYASELVTRALADDFRNASTWEKLLNYYELENKIKKETKRKKINLISKVESLVGKIISLDNIKLDANSNINGYIKGEKGTVSLETIGAGGYNIQRYH